MLIFHATIPKGAVSLLLLLSWIGSAESHGYLLSPRSRNYIASVDGVWSGGGADVYPKDSCPHCANRGGTMGECGFTGEAHYDIPLSILGNVMPADPQAIYSQGEIIEVEVVLTSHHKGHFEFYACPIKHGQAPTSECLQQYPLEFVSDPLYGAVKDVNYPNRAYIAPIYSLVDETSRNNVFQGGSFFRFDMKLPDNLQGDLVLLQWHYFTANTCQYDGYDTYQFPSTWGTMTTSNSICGPNPDGAGIPEQFWNCAEITVVSGPVTPSSWKTPSPVQTSTPAPPTPTSPVVAPTSPDAVGTCGDGNVGNGKCLSSNLCCSKFGWCGITEAHCVTYKAISQSSPSTSPVQSNMAPPTTYNEYYAPSSSPKNNKTGANVSSNTTSSNSTMEVVGQMMEVASVGQRNNFGMCTTIASLYILVVGML